MLGFTILSTSDTAWMMQAYEAIRKAMIAQSGVSVSAALSIGYIILVFKLANIAFKGMSDEQEAGYGGIKLMEIIRPLLIVFAMQSAPTICSVIDSVSCKIAGAINDSVKETKEDVDGTTYLLTMSYGLYNEYSDMVKDIVEGTVTGDTKAMMAKHGITDTHVELSGSGSSGIGSGDTGTGSEFVVIKGNADLLYNVLGDAFSANNEIGAKRAEGLAGSDTIQDMESESPDLVSIIKGNGGVTQALSWLFTVVRQAMLTFSQILLIILAFFFPWTLLFSLFEKWKNAWIGWAGRYVQVSMWPVVISLIWFSTYTLIDGVKTKMLAQNGLEIAKTLIKWKEAAKTVNISDDMAQQMADQMDICDAYFMMYSGIALAGLIALCKLSSIVEMIFPMPEGGSGTGDAGAAMAGGAVTVLQKGGNAAGQTATMGTKVIPGVGKAVGGAQKAAGAAGNVMKGMTK